MLMRSTCVEIKILRRVRAESSRRPPRHRRDACSMAWRCQFLAARPSAPDALVDFHTGHEVLSLQHAETPGRRGQGQRVGVRCHIYPFDAIDATTPSTRLTGPRLRRYFNCTQSVAGVQDTRFQALMPDVLHWLGITKIHNFISMSDMKSRPASLIDGVEEDTSSPRHVSPVDARAGTTPSSSPASRS